MAVKDHRFFRISDAPQYKILKEAAAAGREAKLSDDDYAHNARRLRVIAQSSRVGKCGVRRYLKDALLGQEPVSSRMPALSPTGRRSTRRLSSFPRREARSQPG